MNQEYRFLWESEPSEQQLQGLMVAVLQEVKERASFANQKLADLQKEQIQAAFAKRKERNGRN